MVKDRENKNKTTVWALVFKKIQLFTEKSVLSFNSENSGVTKRSNTDVRETTNDILNRNYDLFSKPLDQFARAFIIIVVLSTLPGNFLGEKGRRPNLDKESP